MLNYLRGLLKLHAGMLIFIFIDVTMVIENRVFVKREALKQCRLICSQN